MRIWSLHPKYLDAKGLVALWREALLAQAVLSGKTKGYRHHPQLLRFRAHASPIGSIGEYLRVVHEEAASRHYRFAAEKITRARVRGRLTVTRDQLEFEWRHLLAKLKVRDPERLKELAKVDSPRPHPLFRVVRGNIEQWERGVAPGESQVCPDNREANVQAYFYKTDLDERLRALGVKHLIVTDAPRASASSRPFATRCSGTISACS